MCLSDQELARELALIRAHTAHLLKQAREIEIAIEHRSFEYHRRTFRSLSSATVILFSTRPRAGEDRGQS
jgi:hypothetical protein